MYQINKKQNKLVYTTTNEHGVKKIKIIPIRDENGNLTKEFIKETEKKRFQEFKAKLEAEKKAKKEETKVEETKVEETKKEENEETTEAVVVEAPAIERVEAVVVEAPAIERVEAEIVEPRTTELMVPETKLAVIDYEEAPAELKAKKKFSWKKFLVVTGLVAGGIFAISRFEGCGAKHNDVTIVATPTPGVSEDDTVVEDDTKVEENLESTPTPVVIPTVEEQLEDSRHTEITTEAFEETVFNLQQELISHGINVNGEDVVKFVALANITHMQETNPELLKTIIGENTDPQQFITDASRLIGQIVYLEVTDKDEQVDWTIALMDKKDKEKADNNMNVFNDAKAYAKGEPIIEGGTYATREEKRIYIETLVGEEIIVKDYDNTTDVQEIGADFITDAITTGFFLADNDVKPFISTPEVVDGLTVISSNKDVVSNLHAIISTISCEEQAKTLTLN